MSNIYLALRSVGKNPTQLSSITKATTSYLPFEPEQSVSLASRDEKTLVTCWSVLSEAARGGFWDSVGNELVTYNGWFVEQCELPQSTMAHSARTMMQRLGAQKFSQTVGGDWSLVRMNADGELDGICDFLGGQHLYYGEHDGLIAVSNRAFLVAAALHGGQIPSLNPFFLSWLLTSAAAPVGDHTVFDHVSLLLAGNRLKVTQTGLSILPIPELNVARDWSKRVEEFQDRVAQIKRLPELPFSLALTGGKDSRLVLAGLLASDSLDSVTEAFLHAHPDHPDVIVGQKLAEQFGLSFRLFEPRTGGDDVFDAFARHNFQTEFSANAWDLKGCDERSRAAQLHGSYGEIYRGHADLTFQLGWPFIRRKYLRRSYIDIADILTEDALDYCRQGLSSFLRVHRESGTKYLHLHDHFHRHVRMQRWMGQLQLLSSLATLSIAPIADPRLLAHYQTLSLRQRQGERVHYELMRRCSSGLVVEPFARDRWSRLLPVARWQGGPAQDGSVHGLSRQLQIWRKFGAEIQEFLLAPGAPSFSQIVDRRRLKKLLDHAGSTPDFVVLRAILAAAAIRHALHRPLETYQLRVQPAQGIT